MGTLRGESAPQEDRYVYITNGSLIKLTQLMEIAAAHSEMRGLPYHVRTFKAYLLTMPSLMSKAVSECGTLFSSGAFKKVLFGA